MILGKKVNKVLVVLLICCMMVMMFSGCGNPKIEAFMNTDLVQVMTARINANRDLLNKLYASGLVTDGEKKKIEESIDKQLSVYMNGISNNFELQQKLLEAIVDWNAPEWEECGPLKTIQYTDSNGKPASKTVNKYGYTKEEWDEEIVTVYLKHNKGILNKLKIPLFKGKDSNIVPISIIDNEVAETLNERFGFRVYVLKPIEMKDGEPVKTLDDLIKEVQEATKDKNNINTKKLAQLFQPAVDINGHEVRLLDVAKRINQVVVNSTGSPLVSDDEYTIVNGKLTKSKVGNKVINPITVENVGLRTPTSNPNPGNDMVIYDKTKQVPLLAIRLHEFNFAGIENIINRIGLNPDQYLFTNNGENIVYIMEYPVSYIKTLKNKTNNINEYECEFSKSNMGINIRTGKIIKYGSAWGKANEPGVYVDDNDSYLNVMGSGQNGKSSFVLAGSNDEESVIELGENKQKVKTGRILLRDYLEITYAPGVISNEPNIVLGRKVRVLKFTGNKGDVVAKYVDKSGVIMDNSPELMVDDFADFESLLGDKPVVKYIGRIGEKLSDTSKLNNQNNPSVIGSPNNNQTNNQSDNSSDNIVNSISKIEVLDKYVVESIKPTSQFPWYNLGEVDIDNSTKPIFYGLVVKKGMFETNMFSGWIQQTSNEGGSLVWWNTWLSNHKYKYNINSNILEEFLAGNYTFELQDSGVVILDLNTIAKIQHDFKTEDRIQNVRKFNTLFIVLGYLLLWYALILIMCWLVDTNVDLGLNLLEKVTLGKWVAVKYIEEDYEVTEGVLMITLGKLLWRCLGIGLLGALIINLDVVGIILKIIKMFSGIAKVIYDLIIG
ncbi:MAG: hypothetical protein QXD03_02520 [Candidatus Anstonellales archaeon]